MRPALNAVLESSTVTAYAIPAKAQFNVTYAVNVVSDSANMVTLIRNVGQISRLSKYALLGRE